MQIEYQYFLVSIITSVIITITGVIALVIKIREHFTLLNRNTVKQSKDANIVNKGLLPKFSFGNFFLYKRLTMKKALRVAKDVARNVETSGFHPTIIVGIGRGGSIFGSLISYNLYHTPILSIDREYEWLEKRHDKMLFAFNIPIHLTQRVLLVAGEAHTGGTMDTFTKYLKSIGSGEIKTCVFYKQSVCTQKIDFCGIEGENTILMPWQDAQSIRDSLSKAQADQLKKVQCLRENAKVI